MKKRNLDLLGKNLSVFLLDAIKDYADMYMDDGDDEQYRKLLVVRNRLEHALSILDPVILLICNFYSICNALI